MYDFGNGTKNNSTPLHTCIIKITSKSLQYVFGLLLTPSGLKKTSVPFIEPLWSALAVSMWLKFLRSKTRLRATPLLPTWIYSCRSRVTVSCALPFTTNVTISASISQTFRSWVAIIPSLPAYGVFISQLILYARACSSYEYYCFILRADRDMSWNVWNRPSGSFMVDMGISSNIMKSPFPKCYLTFWDMTKSNDTLIWSDITPICELITELDFITDFDLITKFWRFP